MTKMKAVGLYHSLPINNPESLIDIEIEKPVPIGRDVLVKVMAISVNPVDVKVRYPNNKIADTPKILGWDVAGIVEEVGPESTLFKVGDEVYYAGSITRPGGNSEYHLVDERIVGKKPNSLNFAEAAALPLTSITAWEGLYDRLGVHPTNNEGKTIVIIGAAGGVGSIATQLAKLSGLTVIGTASRPESEKWTKEKGADYTINHFEKFSPQLKGLGFDSVDYIFCVSDTDKHWDNMCEVIAPQGKICSIVASPEPLNLSLLMGKSVTFVWEMMFTRSTFNTPDIEEQHKLLTRLSEMIDAGQISTTITETLEPINAENLRLAHAKIEEGRTIGKIVLQHFN